MLAQGSVILLCISLISCSYILHAGHDPADRKLVKLAVLVRHGDRSPYTTFPTNPYPFHDLRHWPDGPDQLTVNGKKRMFDVGRFIRKRYAGFLTGDPIHVYARSSPADRCLNSAALVLAAAFPPRGRLRFHSSLDWQPIPIHTEKDRLERMLNTPSRSPCTALTRAKELQKEAPDVREFENKSQELMQEISEHAGQSITKLADVDSVYDALITAKEEGKQLPDWSTDEFLKRMKNVDDKTFCVASSTPLIQRLETGLFWNELKQKFMNETGHQKVFIYSTHDSRMSSFLRLVNGYDGGHPKYGATILFELLQHTSTGEATIRVYFLSNTWSHNLHQLTPTGCANNVECTADMFFDGLKEFTIQEDDYEKECQVLPDQSQLTDCFPKPLEKQNKQCQQVLTSSLKS